MPEIKPLLCASLVCAAAAGWWLGRRASLVDQTPGLSASLMANVSGESSTGFAGQRPAKGVTADSLFADWMTRAEGAGNHDFPGLLEELARLFPGDAGVDGKTMAATRWLLGLWVLKDGEAAVAFVSAQSDPDLKAALGEALARVDPAKALNLLAGRIKNGPDRCMDQAIANRLAVTDPEAFLKLDPSCWGNEAPVAAAFAALAKPDPAKAVALWESLRGTPDFPVKKSLYLLMDSLVSGDSTAARAWAEKLADPTERRMASHTWLAALARRDPRAALREMKDMDLGDFQDPASVESIRLGLPGDFGDGRAAVFLSLARLNRTEGLAALRELLDSNPSLNFDKSPFFDKSYLFSQLVEVSREHMLRYPDDPDSFLDALKGSITDETDPDSREVLQLAYLREQLQGRSAAFALELAKRRALELSAKTGPPEGKPDDALVEMLEHAAESDPEAVLGVMDQMPVRERQQVADQMSDGILLADVDILGRILPWQSAGHWQKVVDTYVGRLSSSPEKLQEMAPSFAALTGEVAVPAVTFFSQMWAQEDPVQTLNWAMSLPQETLPAAVGGAVQSWMKSDDAAASEWADALPAGPVRDAAAAGLTKALFEYDLPSAMAWAGSISDPATATPILEKSARDFSWRDNGEFLQLLPATLDRLEASPEQRKAVSDAMLPVPESGDPFGR
jgi:hypothetical protein